jgi:hypothetical protein
MLAKDLKTLLMIEEKEELIEETQECLEGLISQGNQERKILH